MHVKLYVLYLKLPHAMCKLPQISGQTATSPQGNFKEISSKLHRSQRLFSLRLRNFQKSKLEIQSTEQDYCLPSLVLVGLPGALLLAFLGQDDVVQVLGAHRLFLHPLKHVAAGRCRRGSGVHEINRGTSRTLAKKGELHWVVSPPFV